MIFLNVNALAFLLHVLLLFFLINGPYVSWFELPCEGWLKFFSLTWVILVSDFLWLNTFLYLCELWVWYHFWRVCWVLCFSPRDLQMTVFSKVTMIWNMSVWICNVTSFFLTDVKHYVAACLNCECVAIFKSNVKYFVAICIIMNWLPFPKRLHEAVYVKLGMWHIFICSVIYFVAFCVTCFSSVLFSILFSFVWLWHTFSSFIKHLVAICISCD